MPNASLKNKAYLQTVFDNRLIEALEGILDNVNKTAAAAAIDPTGGVSTPSKISGVNVTAAGGIYDIAIDDNSPVQRGVEYFAEYSTTPGFQQPTAIHIGATRNHRVMLGNQTLYWRAFSQNGPSGPPSQPVHFGGSTPTPVVGGGTVTGPNPQGSRGSGTAPNSGLQGGAGYGTTQNRGNVNIG